MSGAIHVARPEKVFVDIRALAVAFPCPWKSAKRFKSIFKVKQVMAYKESERDREKEREKRMACKYSVVVLTVYPRQRADTRVFRLTCNAI